MPKSANSISSGKPKTSISQQERVAILHFLNTNPKAQQLLNALTHPSAKDNELTQLIAPVIEQHLEKSRTLGIMIGWQAAYIRAYEKALHCETLDELKEMLSKEAETARAVNYMKENYDVDDVINEEFAEALQQSLAEYAESIKADEETTQS